MLSEPNETGARLRWLRRRAGMTQEEMAQHLALSTSHYSKVEIGAKNASPAVIRLAATRFAASERWLMTGDGEPFSGQVQTGSMTLRDERPVYGMSSKMGTGGVLGDGGGGQPPAGWIDRARQILGEERNELEYSCRALGIPVSEVMRRIGERIEQEERR